MGTRSEEVTWWNRGILSWGAQKIISLSVKQIIFIGRLVCGRMKLLFTQAGHARVWMQLPHASLLWTHNEILLWLLVLCIQKAKLICDLRKGSLCVGYQIPHAIPLRSNPYFTTTYIASDHVKSAMVFMMHVRRMLCLRPWMHLLCRQEVPQVENGGGNSLRQPWMVPHHIWFVNTTSLDSSSLLALHNQIYTVDTHTHTQNKQSLNSWGCSRWRYEDMHS